MASRAIPADTMKRVLKMIADATPHQRGLWWCEVNGWCWPREWPKPKKGVADVPREQFETIFSALARNGGDARAKKIWSDRIDRGEQASTGGRLLATFRYTW